MNRATFRKELIKAMPGYNWTVHKPSPLCTDHNAFMSATGIKTSGFNRISTLAIERREGPSDYYKIAGVEYRAKSSGFGVRAPWLGYGVGCTLLQALRSLQTHYEDMARKYISHADDLQSAREKDHQKR